MNMGDKPVSDYGIDLKFTQPAGSYTFKLLMGASALAPVTLDADGSMEGYQPVDELPANTRLILELAPNQ